MNQELGQTQKLSITDENAQKNVEFIEKLEKEKVGIKLYYYMWLSRLFIFFAVVSLAVFMSSSLSLFKLAPKVFVEPFMIIKQDDSKGIVRAEALIDNMASKDTVLELFMRQYVILRNTIVPDTNEMKSRWMPGGMLHFLSSNQVFGEFNKNIESKINGLVQNKLTQSVQIDSIGKVGGQRSPIWKINFTTYQLNPDIRDKNLGAMQLKTEHWTASISAKFFEQRIFMGRRLINPLGFTVIDYSQAKVNVF